MTSTRRGRCPVTSATRWSPTWSTRWTACATSVDGCAASRCGPRPTRSGRSPVEPLPIEPVELQASWSAGELVVWAGGRGADPEDYEALSDRLERVGGPPAGWRPHPPLGLPGGQRADCLTIPVKDVLGWLVAVAGGEGLEGIGASVTWLARVAVEAVRLVASGSIVPGLDVASRSAGSQIAVQVDWHPALVDSPVIVALGAAMPGPVALLDGAAGSTIAAAVITAVVETIVTEVIERMELPAAPPSVHSARDLSDAVVAGMDGSSFHAPAALASGRRGRSVNWSRGVVAPTRPRLVVQVDPPSPGGVWLLSVHAPGDNGARPRSTRPCAASAPAGRWGPSGRGSVGSCPCSIVPGRRAAGQVALSQDEAWQFMTVVGPVLAAVGFDVRVPALSRPQGRRRRCGCSPRPAGRSVVGAHQLSNVAWSVLFDDVELTAAEVAPAGPPGPAARAVARPLGRGRPGRPRAGRRRARRARSASPSSPAPRSCATASASTGRGLRRRRRWCDGNSWANDIVRRAGEARSSPVTRPDGLRRRAAHLPGRGAGLDRVPRRRRASAAAWPSTWGSGKTPTVLAHLAARRRSDGTDAR